MKHECQGSNTVKPRKIFEISGNLGINSNHLKLYGDYIAKLSLGIMEELPERASRLILVTAMTPTPAGEGKTTTSIGLVQGLRKIGKNAIACLREPSLGPCFGMKGGATGGGKAQVFPMEDINLHFTGDIHAVGAANNLLAAMVDNHIYFGKEPRLNPGKITWRRALDMNDRALRNIQIGIGECREGYPRSSGFDITVASEVMAIVCLSKGLSDLKERLGRIIVGYSESGNPVYASDLNAHGAMAALLKDAIMPNLVQTSEGCPCLIHGGPFANIAHGCSSLIATKMGLKLADYVVTEAGFGSDLGAEKFIDIKCRIGGLKPDGIVIVATVKALRYHGNSSDYNLPDLDAVKKGFENLEKHIENTYMFGIPCVVALNKYTNDSVQEIDFVRESCIKRGIEFSLSDVWLKGGEGGTDLAQAVLKSLDVQPEFKFLYGIGQGIKEKISIISKKIYGAGSVEYEPMANESIRLLTSLSLDKLPVCIAKTPLSLSDNPSIRGRPSNFTVSIRDVQPSNGAGFVVALAGNILKMPGLPRHPAAERIDIDGEGRIIGLT